MKKFRDRFFLVLFVAVWSGLTFWNMFAPKVTFSEMENRALEPFPTFTWETLVDGKYMDNINLYFNDHFAGKFGWITANTLKEYATGKREVNGVLLGQGALLPDLKYPNYKTLDKNIEGINEFSQKVGIPSYVMLVPSATAVQPEKLPKFTATLWSEQGMIESANARMGEGVTALNVYNTLRENHNDYIYYRTDHHWTTYGAYLAYQELYAAMGMQPAALNDFAVEDLSQSFQGTYFSKTGYPFVRKDTMQSYVRGQALSMDINYGKTVDGEDDIETKENIFYEDFLDKKDKYSYFFGTLESDITIRTASETGKKLLVFKDSYFHCMAPMMMEEYSEIRMIDLRFFKSENPAETLGASGYDAMLYLYSTDVFSHQLLTANLLEDKA